MRTYQFVASEKGKWIDWPGFEVKTNVRIRQLVIQLFREQFGHDPEEHWHQDGFMAEAWTNRPDLRRVSGSRRDKVVEVTQQNLLNPFSPRNCPRCGAKMRLRKFATCAFFQCPRLCYGCGASANCLSDALWRGEELGYDQYLYPAYNVAPHPRRLLPFNPQLVAS